MLEFDWLIRHWYVAKDVNCFLNVRSWKLFPLISYILFINRAISRWLAQPERNFLSCLVIRFFKRSPKDSPKFDGKRLAKPYMIQQKGPCKVPIEASCDKDRIICFCCASFKLLAGNFMWRTKASPSKRTNQSSYEISVLTCYRYVPKF